MTRQRFKPLRYRHLICIGKTNSISTASFPKVKKTWEGGHTGVFSFMCFLLTVAQLAALPTILLCPHISALSSDVIIFAVRFVVLAREKFL